MTAAVAPRPSAPVPTVPPLVVLVGNPNSGKTTVFNALTGMSARVGNYPGITVEHREGRLALASGGARVVDLPGTYSLVPRSDDEAVALRGLLGTIPGLRRPDLVVAVVDATNLERNLYLVAELRELRLPMVVALTMTDTLEADGARLEHERLAERLGVPVVPVAAVRSGGVDALAKELGARLARPSPPPVEAAEESSAELQGMGAALAAELGLEAHPRALARWSLAVKAAGSLGQLALPGRVIATLEQPATEPREIEDVISERYALVRRWAAGIVIRPSAIGPGGRASEAQPRSERLTERIDRIALHPVVGPLLLLGVFGALFQALFTWAAPVMDVIDALLGALSGRVSELVPEDLPLLRSLLADGVLAGAGNVLVFVPQIAMLFLFLGFLEDSGYLARAAFLLDRLMARVGLHGRAFVPMLSGFACAVPAIMATRTIENEKDRLVTILATPLMSCSARLPVYGLMIATMFATVPPVFGVVQAGAVVMISMYALSVIATLATAAILKRTLLRSPPPPFVLELPPYRMPRAGQLIRYMGSKVRSFIVEAGTIILAITIVLWGLFNFPRTEEVELRHAAALSAAAELPETEQAERVAEAEAAFARETLEHSIAGRVGKSMEPVLEPLGWDWKIGVGLLASFAAREVLVSTLGLVYGLGDGADEESPSLREAMRQDRHPDTGEPIHTPLSGLALMVFFALAMQCMSTLAAVRRETRSWRWPLFQFTYMTVLAYVAALAVYQGGRLLGFG